eukprot:TRINITY_DN14448_c0_g1_i1.p1 TRINITY_DN14448_c0_g1~~TRINITY_DN14448_c0_g1_i1.p1  ORF type:complete len:475 (+),score=49.63 TRINITY_DN14448_c0_g1_i1:93-1427(+)
MAATAVTAAPVWDVGDAMDWPDATPEEVLGFSFQNSPVGCLVAQQQGLQGRSPIAATAAHRDGALRREECLARAAVREEAASELAAQLSATLGAVTELFTAQRRVWAEEICAHEAVAATLRRDLRETTTQVHTARLCEPLTRAEQSAREGHTAEALAMLRALALDSIRQAEQIARDAELQAEAEQRSEVVRHERVAPVEPDGPFIASGEEGPHKKKARRSRRGGRRHRKKRGDCHGLRRQRQEGDAGTSPSHGGVCAADEGAARGSTPANEALFIDHICFWLAAFAPRSWAPVCSKSARMVLATLHIFHSGWEDIVFQIACFQSMGIHDRADNTYIGPGVGPLHWATLEVQNLLPAARAAFPLGRGVPLWANRWVLYMDQTVNLYEEMRLAHKALFFDGITVMRNIRDVKETVAGVLALFDQRTEPVVEDADGEAHAAGSSPTR